MRENNILTPPPSSVCKGYIERETERRKREQSKACECAEETGSERVIGAGRAGERGSV